jgi:hypothetical protein
MDKRACIHEAGHFYLAWEYGRAFSICIANQVQTDDLTGEEYLSRGHVKTSDHGALPKVLLSIRAAGLAAESLVYNELLDDLMGNPTVQFSIKTDTDHAKQDLVNAGLPPSTEAEFRKYWDIGFSEAWNMMRNSQDKLHRIAEYCLANLGREILTSEIVANCHLS